MTSGIMQLLLWVHPSWWCLGSLFPWWGMIGFLWLHFSLVSTDVRKKLLPIITAVVNLPLSYGTWYNQFWNFLLGIPKLVIQGVPHLRGFHYHCEFHYHNFWLMHSQVGDLGICRGHPTVPLTIILRNAVFFKYQNPHKAGTVCNVL